jgi:hypothetical protein
VIRPAARLRRLAAAGAALLALGAPAPAHVQAREAAAGGEILVMLRLSPDHLRPNAGYGGDYGDQTARLIRRRLAERIAHRHGLEMVGEGWPMPLVGLDCYQMRVTQGRSAEAAAAEVSREPQVAWAQPVQTFRGAGDDPAQAPRPVPQPVVDIARSAGDR